MSEAWPYAPPEGWCTMIRLFGSDFRCPGAPAASSSEPMEAAWPMQIVCTWLEMYCIVS